MLNLWEYRSRNESRFEKAYEAIWKCVLLGDPEIDPKTVDNSKKVEEFDQGVSRYLKRKHARRRH